MIAQCFFITGAVVMGIFAVMGQSMPDALVSLMFATLAGVRQL